MQEDIERRSVAISITATKMTGRVLAWCLMAIARKINKEIQKGKTPKGKQSLEKLMNHRGPTNTIPLDGDRQLFDRIAAKHDIDYAFEQVGPEKYLLTFRAAQVDAMTACFAEYSQRVMEKSGKHPSIAKQLEQYKDMAARTAQVAPRERERVLEAVRDGR